MDVVVILLILAFGLAVPIILGCVCAHIAGNKGRNKVGYFFLGFFFSLIGVIITLLVDDLHTGRKKRVVYEEYEDDEE